MAFRVNIKPYTQATHTFNVLDKTNNRIQGTIISPSGRLSLHQVEPVNCDPSRIRPQIFPVPEAGPDFNVGDFPPIITPSTIDRVQTFDIGADIQAQIQSIVNPQELALTTHNRSQLNILQALDVNKLISNTYSQDELVKISRELNLPYPGKKKEQLLDQIYVVYQAYQT